MYVCGEIVGEVDGALATHSLPGAFPGNAFGGGAAPEEGIFFLRERGIWVHGGSVIEYFVDVIPWRRIEDVGVALDFALREYGQQLVRGFVGCWSKVEAMEVTKVGLVAGRSCKRPITQEDSMRMRSCARRA